MRTFSRPPISVAVRAFFLIWALAFGVRADAQDEPTLRIALTQEPATLNPLVATLAVETDLTQFLFSGLTRYDERGDRVPDLAVRLPTRENGDISRDGRTITYHLVHNARWQDGSPVTSEDVKFTADALLNPLNNVPIRPDQLERVETPDPYTVRLVLKRPWAPALDWFSARNQYAILPAHLLAKYPDLNHVDFNGAPVGSGPYRLVAWRRGSDMLLEADPQFYRGAAKIKRVSIRFLTNDSTMTIAIRTHELDLADRLNISTYIGLGSLPGMLPAIAAQSQWEHLNFNTNRPPLNDPRVRLALCYAFDVREIYAKVAHGLGALGPTAENPVTPWYNHRLDYYPFDPKRASRLLDEAGWKIGPGGVRVKNGKRLSLTMVSTAGNITREQTEIILQQRWQAVGVETTIKNGPAGTVFALAANGGPLYSGNYDVALFAWVSATPDPTTRDFNSADLFPPAGQNVSFYRNAELTRLEMEAASTFEIAARKRMYDRIQEIELRELPYYVLRWVATTDVRNAALIGVRPGIVGSTFWNVAQWRFAH